MMTTMTKNKKKKKRKTIEHLFFNPIILFMFKVLFNTITCWMVYNPNFFVVRINEFHGILVDHFHYVASIHTSNRIFLADNLVASVVKPKFIFFFLIFKIKNQTKRRIGRKIKDK